MTNPLSMDNELNNKRDFKKQKNSVKLVKKEKESPSDSSTYYTKPVNNLRENKNIEDD